MRARITSNASPKECLCEETAKDRSQVRQMENNYEMKLPNLLRNGVETYRMHSIRRVIGPNTCDLNTLLTLV